MVSCTRALLKYVMMVVEGGSRAAAPKGSMTYAFTHMGNFPLLLLLLLLLLRTPPPPKLHAHISASRPISQPQGPNPSLEAQIPVKDLGLKTEIRALRLGYGPRG